MNLDVYFEKCKTESFYRLNSARVVYCDYDLILRDFRSSLPSLEGCPAREKMKVIDSWLLGNCALISEPHAEDKDCPGNQFLTAYRPQGYGRGAVRRVSNGWFDLKGVGVPAGQRPECSTHGTGLLNLYEAILEVLWYQIISKIFKVSGVSYNVVPHYAVIDTGLDVKWRADTSRFFPSAILVRGGQPRSMPKIGDLPMANSRGHVDTILIELLLRKYGITSGARGRLVYRLKSNRQELIDTRHSPTEPTKEVCGLEQELLSELGALFGNDDTEVHFDTINVQLTDEGNLIDLSHFKVRHDFTNPIMSKVRDRIHSWGGCLKPTSSLFQTAKPGLALPEDKLGISSADPVALGLPPLKVVLNCESRFIQFADKMRSSRLEAEEVGLWLRAEFREAVRGSALEEKH